MWVLYRDPKTLIAGKDFAVTQVDLIIIETNFWTEKQKLNSSDANNVTFCWIKLIPRTLAHDMTDKKRDLK